MDKEAVDFRTEVLSKLAVIESKLDGYKEVKQITYDNKNDIKNQGEKIVDHEQRLSKLEEKPQKRYDSILTQIVTFVIEAVLIIVAVKIGLK